MVLTQNNLTDVIVEPYGSIVNNFLTKDGDIDVSIVPQSISKDEFGFGDDLFLVSFFPAVCLFFQKNQCFVGLEPARLV